jgi:hypothetical protein
MEWLSDNGSPYIAGDIRTLARYIGLRPCTTPIQSPQSNGTAWLNEIDQIGRAIRCRSAQRWFERPRMAVWGQNRKQPISNMSFCSAPLPELPICTTASSYFTGRIFLF